MGQHSPPIKTWGPVETYGRNIQRTMTLLATSTPEKRNTVRILFYGQSITEQNWRDVVETHLRTCFPHADLVIESRAIGGHAAQLLVKTMEADVYAFCPDLVIFHVYGSHTDYEQIIRNIRQRTSAEVLMQTDHCKSEKDLAEEMDRSKLGPSGDAWDAFMNHAWLPRVADKYGCELCDVRSLWKAYLADYDLKPQDLLKDGVHLNPHGEFVMGTIVATWLRFDKALADNAADSLVRDYVVGQDVLFDDAGQLSLEFEGQRIDLIGEAGRFDVLLDGQRPTQIHELYSFTRTRAFPGMNWPCLLRVGHHAPRVAEDWTATLSSISLDGKQFEF